MPRQARLDAPGTLHHVMVRGIERTTVFRDDADRTDFVARLAQLATQGALTVYAWALLPNHAHVLLRTGPRPLARSMRSLLTGYAGAFNRRHKRVGHLFQNRYRSIVVEAEPYLRREWSLKCLCGGSPSRGWRGSGDRTRTGWSAEIVLDVGPGVGL